MTHKNVVSTLVIVRIMLCLLISINLILISINTTYRPIDKINE